MKKYALFIALFLFLPGILAVNQNYQVSENNVMISIQGEGDITFDVPYDSYDISSNVEYSITNFKDFKRISINENFEFNFSSKSYIEESRSNFFFVLHNPIISSSDILVSLPEGFVLPKENILFPTPSEISTDGRQIFLNWDNTTEERFLISYESIKGNFLFLYILIALLVVSLGIGYYLHRKKFNRIAKVSSKNISPKKSNHSNLTRNLIGEEKNIVSYLLNKKGKQSWTKNISKDLKINKVRLSRKLRSLEQKGLIEKIPYGNENRVKLKKN